jgi:hypothetical protein
LSPGFEGAVEEVDAGDGGDEKEGLDADPEEVAQGVGELTSEEEVGARGVLGVEQSPVEVVGDDDAGGEGGGAEEKKKEMGSPGHRHII